MSKLIYISVFNFGAIEMAKNHLKSLRNVGITNHCSYVTDEESYRALKELGYPVQLIKNNDIKKEGTNFGTPEFNNMSYVRYHVIKHLLLKGYDVWYMDVDTVVLQPLQNVYEEHRHNSVFDVLFQSDVNMPCTGCMLVYNRVKSVNFIDAVIEQQNDQHNDQLLVNFLLKRFPDLVKTAKFTIFMFPNGLVYFDEEFVKCPEQYRDVRMTYEMNPDNVVHFVHANWMVGDEMKTKALKKHGLWFI
jgi:hypothetical protein